MVSAAGAAETTRVAKAALAASAVDLSRLRRESIALYPENLAIARLDLVAHLLDRGGIVLHQLDCRQRLAARLFLRLRVHRTQPADVDDELLRLRRERIALE